MRRSPRQSHLTFTLLALLAFLVTCTPAYRPGLPPSSPFLEDKELGHGVATGDVTDSSALVWFRTTGPANVQVEWAREGSGTARSPVIATTQDHDFTASVRVEGLVPASSYSYRILEVSGVEQVVLQEVGKGQFRTSASSNVPETVTFLWGGDLGGQQQCRLEGSEYAIFDRMFEARPAFALLLGDLIYADGRCPSPPNVPGGDFLASTLEGFRAKHRYQREDRALRRFLSVVPVYAMWDDHEVRNNFSGPDEPLMPAGRQALLEYWPIGTPPEDPHRLYRKFRRGADLELFLLDTRQYRSRNEEPDGEHKTMLGTAQREWLVDGLTRSTATWKVIATSVPLSNRKPGTALLPGNDSWAPGPDGTGYQTELRTIVSTILDRRIRNVVWLAADVHYAQINAYDPDGDGVADFHEFISGPLSAASVKPLLPDPALRPSTLYSGGGFSNFGLVTVNGTSLRVAILDEEGDLRFARTFSARGTK